ncbi:MAG: outer membrane beta-barrel protein [Saprospiraceae bacterium]
MNQQNFDKLVREKLAALEVEQAANSWELFTQKRTAIEATSAAATDVFDQAIKDKIGDFSALAAADSWDLFEQKLGETASTPIVDASELDNTVYNKLYNYQVPYEAETWSILLAKMRARTWQKVEIIVYKTAELALLFLFFLFGQQFFTTPELQSLPIAKDKIATVTTNNNLPSNSSSETTTKTRITRSTDTDVSSTSTLANEKVDKHISNRNSIIKKTNDASLSVITNTNSTEIIPVQKEEEEKIERRINVKELTRLNTPVAVVKYDGVRSLWVEEELNALPTVLHEVKTGSSDELAPVLLLAPEKKRTVRFGMFGAGSIDYGCTPQDRLFTEIAAYDRYSPGYGGGFSLSKQFLNNRWEVETGLLYVSKRYSQQVVVNFFGGSLRNGYEIDPTPSYIEMNIINIPVNIRYNLINSNKWKMYGLGGASLQLILQANYDRNIEDILRFSAAPPEGIENSPNNTAKRFNNGFFADSNFKSNRYYSYNIGLGLERFVSPRWSLFAQPTYQHTIKAFNSEGIGPNRDRINTMLIMLGAKVGL